jgi:molybdopterin-guanine dinucleotide biosynthesis protein B
MKRVHIIGGKNHGKTTLVGELIAEFRSRGLRVGSIKHTHHHHELDTPGKDSHQHRKSGAEVAGILSPSMNAVFWWDDHAEREANSPHRSEQRYASSASAFSHCDLVPVEGDTRTGALKLEVWRASLDMPPLAEQISDVRALVTDGPTASHLPILPRSKVGVAADFITKHCEELAI